MGFSSAHRYCVKLLFGGAVPVTGVPSPSRAPLPADAPAPDPVASLAAAATFFCSALAAADVVAVLDDVAGSCRTEMPADLAGPPDAPVPPGRREPAPADLAAPPGAAACSGTAEMLPDLAALPAVHACFDPAVVPV